MKKYIFILLLLSLPRLHSFSQTLNRVDTLVIEGIKLHDEGKYHEAILKYKGVLEKNPNSISALYELSLSYLSLNEFENAIKYSTQVINMGYQPVLIDAIIVKATALAKTKKLDVAIDLLNNALKNHPDNYLLNYNLGLSYYNAGEKKVALFYIKKAIDIDRTHPEAFLIYAYILRDLDMWIQSVYSYQFYLLQEPNSKYSRKAFREMYALLYNIKLETITQSDKGLGLESLYQKIESLQKNCSNGVYDYNFFYESSYALFSAMDEIAETKAKGRKGIFWDFFIPIFSELLDSEYFPTYTRYISACNFEESVKWWNSHADKVNSFINWFEGIDNQIDEENYPEFPLKHSSNNN